MIFILQPILIGDIIIYLFGTLTGIAIGIKLSSMRKIKKVDGDLK